MVRGVAGLTDDDRPQLLKKINVAAKSMGFVIKGIRLDLKHFHAKPITELQPQGGGPRLPEPDDGQLEAVELREEERLQVAQLLADLRDNVQLDGSPVSPERVAALLEKELRLRHWRKAHGYPQCSACGIPASVLHDDDRICLPCFYGA